MLSGLTCAVQRGVYSCGPFTFEANDANVSPISWRPHASDRFSVLSDNLDVRLSGDCATADQQNGKPAREQIGIAVVRTAIWCSDTATTLP